MLGDAGCRSDDDDLHVVPLSLPSAGALLFYSLFVMSTNPRRAGTIPRSEEHTSELQSLRHLVCRLLLEKKKKKNTHHLHEKKRETFVKSQPETKNGKRETKHKHKNDQQHPKETHKPKNTEVLNDSNTHE